MMIPAGFALVVMTGKLDISIGSIAFLATGIGADLLMKQDYPRWWRWPSCSCWARSWSHQRRDHRT